MRPSALLLAPLLLLSLGCSSPEAGETLVDDAISDKADSSKLIIAATDRMTLNLDSGPHILNYANEQVDLNLSGLLSGGKIANASEFFWTEVRGHVVNEVPADATLRFQVDGPDVTILTRPAIVGALSQIHQSNEVTIQTGDGGSFLAMIIPREITAGSTSISYSIKATVD